jgi:ABC-type phosphate/phosphonate transport system permease subunit
MTMSDEERGADEGGRASTGETMADQATPAPSATRAPRKRRWGVILFGVFVILPILLIALWTTIALNWSYSRGERAGYIQKFSNKGWICKTWEGEIAMVNMPGQAQEKFAFSVRSDSIAHAITQLMGDRVAISYEQHPGIPLRCFGETDYFVTGVQKATAP